jgi:hypothetical protein
MADLGYDLDTQHELLAVERFKLEAHHLKPW